MAVFGRTSYGTLFELLRMYPETTRTELVQMSGLSKATISEAVSRLMEVGLIAETGKRQPNRGRSQVVLALQPAMRQVIGAQFTGDGCFAVLADLRAGPIAWAKRDHLGQSPEGFVEALVACVEELRAQASAPVLGIGIGVPGLVDGSGREVILSVTYGWEHVPICDMLEQRLGMRVTATNRSKAAALGEFWQGNHTGRTDNLAYINIGAGISAGFVNQGKLFTGSGGSAGEIGHTTVLPDGPTCACGNRGCLHVMASERALLQTVRNRVRGDPNAVLGDELPLNALGTLTMEKLHAAADEGDATVLEAINETGTWVGLALANMINLINPSLVVLGGSIPAFGQPFLTGVREEVRRRALWDALHGMDIVLSSLGETAGTLGSAALFLDTLNVETILA